MTDYCKHGTYVGGCGIDYMCPRCENNDDIYQHPIRETTTFVKGEPEAAVQIINP